MKELLSKQTAHMLWKDEFGDDFLLLKYAEVYKYSENVLRLYIFSKQKLCQITKNFKILNEINFDEHFTVVDVEKKNLDALIAMGSYKRRPRINGKWIKNNEKRLGHKIIPFEPTFKKP